MTSSVAVIPTPRRCLARRAMNPFLLLNDVRSILNEGSSTDMMLTLRGKEWQLSPSYHAELRRLGQERAEIDVFVGYREWFSKVKEPLSVKVWGADRKRGPVIVETPFGVLVPRGPGATMRRSW